MWHTKLEKPTILKPIVYVTSNMKMGVLNPKNDWTSWEFYVRKYNIGYWTYQHTMIDYFKEELA